MYIQTLSSRYASPLSSRSGPPTIDGSETTFIIVVVAASIGGIVLAYIVYRVIRRCSVPRTVPLPPVQPIAHHRERQNNEFLNKSAAVWQDGYLTPSSQVLTPGGSDISLLHNKNRDSDTFSFLQVGSYMQETKDASQENLPSLSQTDPSMPVSLPSHAFQQYSSSSSLASHEEMTSRSTSQSSGQPNLSELMGHSITAPNPHRPRSTSAQHARPRPNSIASTHAPRRARSVARGAPRGPRSQVNIVLPPPLAPALHPGAENVAARLSLDNARFDVSARTSMVDQWVPVAQHAVRPSSSADDIFSILERPMAMSSSLSRYPQISRSSHLQIFPYSSPPSSSYDSLPAAFGFPSSVSIAPSSTPNLYPNSSQSNLRSSTISLPQLGEDVSERGRARHHQRPLPRYPSRIPVLRPPASRRASSQLHKRSQLSIDNGIPTP